MTEEAELATPVGLTPPKLSVRDLVSTRRSASRESAVALDVRGRPLEGRLEQVTELRRQVRAAGASYRVVKNTVAKRALSSLSGGSSAMTALSSLVDVFLRASDRASAAPT